MRLRKILLALAAFAAAALVLPSGAAQAATSPHPAPFKIPPGARIVRIISPRVLRPASAAQQSCSVPVEFEGANGLESCVAIPEYIILDPGTGPGTVEEFIVGIDGAVWTAWGTADGTLMHGWESMGGNVSSLNCAWTDDSGNAVIQAWGPQGNQLWCRYRSRADQSWSDWFQCDNWTVPQDQSRVC